ncbi:N-acetylglucosamine-specific PTS transporter subunit IIBC [Sporolactobacillus shoreicorticis]|uniref:N-acetylglucosamine-specific PTS transporter subunit IIBC n=1 Tax=Sporolactobacillus shoreicorticis TaxID=1923877 RepID=A0ABW5S619_9BACL|nr:N-acetylglucosamine-specific PTS transporter subunit IIBC [Sporolactobacillus shoreicorticis]MCO7126686.1 N-acetylglucosamine-specific PTS transporter subunit IIBC [Sporolactobacillus shoreicorticis]
MLGFLQRIGKSLMLPIAALPAAALLLRFGQPDLLNIPFIAAAGNAVFSNLALIFAIGIAVGFAKDNNGAAALAGAMGFFVLSACATSLNKTINLGVLGGIIAGIIAGMLYNRYHNIKLPDWLAFFGGRRFVPIVTSGAMLVLGFIFGYVWPYVQTGMSHLATWLYDAGVFGAAIYGLLNRLLLPLGLHHVINTLVWFEFGTFKGFHGEITRFLNGDPHAGLLLSGFFPIMMFGLPAACFAMIAAAKKEKRKAVTGMLAGIALTSFVTGVTEPIEFSFMFLAPALYVIHAILTALSLAVTYMLGIHDGFSFSAGAIDYIINYRIAQKPLLLLFVGIIFAAIYFVVFYFAIKWFDLKTPGREDDDLIETNPDPNAAGETGDKYEAMAARFIKDIGGKENITNIDHCTTRLRLTVADSQIADGTAMKHHGAHGVVKVNKTNLQIIVGTDVEFVADAMKKLVQSSADLPDTGITASEPSLVTVTIGAESVCAPIKGKLLSITDVPDKVFSEKMMGDGFAIDPEEGLVVSPVDGKVSGVFPTKHAIGLTGSDGLEVLIHIGIDTVTLNGEGFINYVQEGEGVVKGQKLISFDIEAIKDKVPSLISPVIFTNLDPSKHVVLKKSGHVALNESDIVTFD